VIVGYLLRWSKEICIALQVLILVVLNEFVAGAFYKNYCKKSGILEHN